MLDKRKIREAAEKIYPQIAWKRRAKLAESRLASLRADKNIETNYIRTLEKDIIKLQKIIDRMEKAL